MIMWRNVMRPAVLPFVVGSVVGAAAGARVFVALHHIAGAVILGAFILLVTWMPKLGRFGAERSRFGVLGFVTTFLGVFVSATGTLLAPFVGGVDAGPPRPCRDHGRADDDLASRQGRGVRLHRLRRRPLVPLMVAMIATGAVGNWIGEVALHRTTERRLR